MGVTAWTDRTLVESGELYPPTVTSPEQRLRFYAAHFPVTEVDSTFYHPPAERTSEVWAERTPPDFRFDVKAFRLLTWHPTPPSELWRDLREALPPEQARKERVYARDLPPDLVAEALRRFASALDPLQDSGRLGLILFQLPAYLYPSPVAFEYLAWVAAALQDRRVGVEFRQGRWMDAAHRARTLAFLAEHDLVYVCVDEPQGVRNSVPPIAAATADLAAVRFHGRNDEAWDAPGLTPAQRHAYDYRDDELAEWVPRIASLHEGDRPVHLLFNNTYRGYAVRSARALARLLAERPEV
ncbi:DUF72 domain-containing protein [Pseudonocardia sp. K10HN5]|uniref:DUF72 domain-containing protein n=1 Tax=Pseudonocardia acidicola TaxID=2724939 RepID=A0ABX1S792_9PSEU|nr:DUF72 domain-containing protein [Pseudonocardia acidicola]